MRIVSNRLKDIIKFAKQELADIYTENECRSLALMLLEHYVQISPAVVLASPEATINESDLLKINFAIKDLRNHKPIQYILGQTTFCGLTLKVNEDVLIPRPETEELVGIIVKENQNRAVKIADLGCGSGCISLALAHLLPAAEVTGFDISEKAIEVARFNAAELGINVRFECKDILKADFTDEKFDIIVSNPPYVRELEKQQMKANVLNYEPHQALFVPNDNPLKFYQSIAAFSSKNLNSKGKIYLEINENLSNQTAFVFSQCSHKVEIMRDLFNRKRFLIVEKAG
ncbi:MAG: peptide chain release factor N(5)-glutamine methyltransferase [Bacteroidales bacterium]|jgi:release factor glutamine methyltransferase|nr:peptide chain release factor N(5)-glutamine methyltransferase [Bacteroidales bacterium]